MPSTKKHSGVDTQRDAGLALLDLVQGGAADGRPLGQDRHGDTPAAARIPDIMPQLTQGAADGYGRLREWVLLHIASTFVIRNLYNIHDNGR